MFFNDSFLYISIILISASGVTGEMSGDEIWSDSAVVDYYRGVTFGDVFIIAGTLCASGILVVTCHSCFKPKKCLHLSPPDIDTLEFDEINATHDSRNNTDSNDGNLSSHANASTLMMKVDDPDDLPPSYNDVVSNSELYSFPKITSSQVVT